MIFSMAPSYHEGDTVGHVGLWITALRKLRATEVLSFFGGTDEQTIGTLPSFSLME
jgi:hypothetical protein